MATEFENYQKFVAALQYETDIVWAVANGEGYASCESNDLPDREVMLLWSEEALAKAVCVEEWAEFQPEPVRVEDLLEHWLPQMHDDGVLVGVNWNENLEGAEQEPLLLLDDILADDDD